MSQTPFKSAWRIRSWQVRYLSIVVAVFVAGTLILGARRGIAQLAKPDSAQQEIETGRAVPKPDTVRLPVVSWNVDWAITRTRPGYPLLKQVEHQTVHLPSLASGVYHHHPQIVLHNDRFFVSWSNHPLGEDGPGQKVIGAVSDDGKIWKSLGDVFQRVDNIEVSTSNGRSLIASPFLKLDGRLFAVAIVNEGVGFGTMETPVDGEPASQIKTSKFRKRIRRGLGTIVREIHADGSLGKPFWIGETKPSPVPGFPEFQRAEELNDESLSAEFVSRLASRLKDPVQMSPWDFCSPATETVAKDGSRLCEPTTYAANNGTLVRYLRDLNGSQKLYAQFSFDDGRSWSVGERTTIPDAPSKTCVGRLPNGTYFLIGNQVVSKRGTRRDPLTIGLSKDGVTFETAYAIRWRAPKLQVPGQQKGPDGRGRGFQYPSFAIGKDALWVVYSVNKEAIDVSRISLTELSND